MLKLSIIVPIYKVEPFLCKCVDSLLEQDIPSEDYEIILVDDGSPDCSGRIADEYAARKSNVRVVHQENQGLGAARNTGIQVAKGKFIQFVDSDDFLEPNVLGPMVKKMEEERLDVLRFNYQNVNSKYEVFDPYKEKKPFVDYRDEVCDGLTFLSERLGFACYAVQFMMRLSFIKDSCLLFKSDVYFEDTEWTPRMLSIAKRVTSVEKKAYNYLMREGSITQSSLSKRRKVLNDKLSLVDSLQSQAQIVADKRWYDGMVSATAFSILTMLSSDFYDERKKYLRELKEKKVFPLSFFHCTDRTARKYRIVNLSPILFCFLHHLKNLKNK